MDGRTMHHPMLQKNTLSGHHHLLTTILWSTCGASLKGRSMRVCGSVPRNRSSRRQYWHPQLKYRQNLYMDLQVQWMRELLKSSQRRVRLLICNLHC
ncbi:hypothetical protein AMELA_G00070990, partial [Ameiurus melas]